MGGARADTINWKDLSEYFGNQMDVAEREEEEEEEGLAELDAVHEDIGNWWKENRDAFIILDFREINAQLTDRQMELRAAAAPASSGSASGGNDSSSSSAVAVAAAPVTDAIASSSSGDGEVESSVVNRAAVAPQNPQQHASVFVAKKFFPDAVAISWIERQPFSFCGIAATIEESEIVVDDEEDDLLAGDGGADQFEAVSKAEVVTPTSYNAADVFSSHADRNLLRRLDGTAIAVHAARPASESGRMEIIWSSVANVPGSGNRSSKAVGKNFAKGNAGDAAAPSTRKGIWRLIEQFAKKHDERQTANRKAKGSLFYRAYQWAQHEREKQELESRKKRAAAAVAKAAAKKAKEDADEAKGTSSAAINRKQSTRWMPAVPQEEQEETDSEAPLAPDEKKAVERKPNANSIYMVLSEAERKRMLRDLREEHRDRFKVPGFGVSVGAASWIKVQRIDQTLRNQLQLVLRAKDMPSLFATGSARGVRTFKLDPRTDSPQTATSLGHLWAKRTSLLLSITMGRGVRANKYWIGEENLVDGQLLLQHRIDFVMNQLRPYIVAIEGDSTSDPIIPPAADLHGKQASAFATLKLLNRGFMARLVTTDWRTAVQEPERPARKKRKEE
eukprot:g10272.t1